MKAGPPINWLPVADAGLRRLEYAAYLLLGLMLATAAGLALVNAAASLYQALGNFRTGTAIVSSVDKLLFVFMLVEILHTVRASLSQGGLSAEPFLVVGLIASIRRVLVITMQTSQETKSSGWTPETQAMVHASMIELGMMAALILVMVVSIYLLHRARPGQDQPVGTTS